MKELEYINELLREKNYTPIKSMLVKKNAIYISRILSEISGDKLPIVFRLLPKKTAAEVFVKMDSERQMLLIRGFTDTELKDVFDELFVDDTVDILEEMPANVVARVLAGTDVETRRAINEILNYPEHSTGSIMTVEFVSLKADMSIKKAIEHIKMTGVDKETIYTCYVTDRAKKLIGVVSVKDMLLSEESTLISEIMTERFIYVNTTEDRESAVMLFSQYGLMAIPVVDGEMRLVGIVTYDDAINVIVKESGEDVSVMAAITPSDKPYLKTGVLELWRSRYPWLLLMMLSATVTGLIITGFEESLAAQAALTAYIPMLMSTGGNTGSQSSTTVIRGLSVGEVEFRDVFRVIWKELRVGILCAVTLSLAIFAKIYFLDILIIHTEGVTVTVGAVVCITLALTVVMAKLVGCTLPILAKRIKLDPAVMAAPFITTILDALSLVVYFFLASSFLGI